MIKGRKSASAELCCYVKEIIMALTKNKKVLEFVEKCAALAQPSNIVWIDGSANQIKALKEEAVKSGELIKLNENLLPDCYLHRTKVNDVARVEDRTFICTKNRDDAGPVNYWMDPKQAYHLTREIARASMKGRTMYVIPYSMGVVGSEFAKIGIEVTDSIYVVLNMNIMTRVGKQCLKALGKKGSFIKGFHAKCNVDAEKRYIMHFPEDNTIISVNSAYGGNVLLGKAHAYSRHHFPRRSEEIRCGRIPLGMRKDQSRHAHSPQALP